MSERMEVDAETVKHISELAKIDLEDEEVEIFTRQFKQIISYFDILDEVPEIEIQLDVKNVLRNDKKENSLPREEVFQNIDETTKKDYFKGPKVR
jgi:aspartyl-tRNA(Asn)/glutamyl-tRNA(Gln) amidotransferase subunit C